jgi:hypothetical protein
MVVMRSGILWVAGHSTSVYAFQDQSLLQLKRTGLFILISVFSESSLCVLPLWNLFPNRLTLCIEGSAPRRTKQQHSKFLVYVQGDSTVVTGCVLNEWKDGDRALVGSRILSSLQNARLAHDYLTTCAMGAGESFPGGKVTRAWSWPLASN